MVERKNKMKGKEILLSGGFKQCVAFHGHVCPGLAIGFQSARLLMRRLSVRKAPDEELVAMVETDACGADAIQVMTGCTFGKGNLIFRNHGKHAFSLVDRKRKRGLRVCLRPDLFKADSEFFSLFEKVRNDEASLKQIERFRQLQQRRTKNILNAEPASLFKIEEISPDIPPKARIMESGTCNLCGEPTRKDLLLQMNGKRICISCAQQWRQ